MMTNRRVLKLRHIRITFNDERVKFWWQSWSNDVKNIEINVPLLCEEGLRQVHLANAEFNGISDIIINRRKFES